MGQTGLNKEKDTMAKRNDALKEMQGIAKAKAEEMCKGKSVPQILRMMWEVSGGIETQLTENIGSPRELLEASLLYDALSEIARKLTMDAGVGTKGTDCPLYTKYVPEVYGIDLKTQEEIDEVNARMPKAKRFSKRLMYDTCPDLAAKYDDASHRTPVPMNKAYASVLGGMALIKQAALILDIIVERQEIKDHYLE